MVKEVKTIEEFELFRKRGPLLVDFFTTWCAPCNWQSSVLESIETKSYAAEEEEDRLNDMFEKISIIKIDCDILENLADVLEISAIPQLILFNGEHKDEPEGMLDEQYLQYLKSIALKMKSGTKDIEKIAQFLDDKLN